MAYTTLAGGELAVLELFCMNDGDVGADIGKNDVCTDSSLSSNEGGNEGAPSMNEDRVGEAAFWIMDERDGLVGLLANRELRRFSNALRFFDKGGARPLSGGLGRVSSMSALDCLRSSTVWKISYCVGEDPAETARYLADPAVLDVRVLTIPPSSRFGSLRRRDRLEFRSIDDLLPLAVLEDKTALGGRVGASTLAEVCIGE